MPITRVLKCALSEDKLNHFMHWGDAHTRELSTEDALAVMRRVVPRDLIGEHAFGHWESHVEWTRGTRVDWGEKRRRWRQSMVDSLRFRLGQALRNCGTFHAELNRRIAWFRVGYVMHRQPGVRLLLGLHDVDAFLEAIAPRFNGDHTREHTITEQLLGEHGYARRR